MSLQVWLPLTKDLRQQGLSNVMVINNGATFNSTGKLGGCYYFNRSSSNYLKINNPLTSSANGVSMAFWVKLPSNGSVNDQLVHIGNGSGWTNNRFTCFVRGGNSTLIFCCGDGTNSTQYNCVSSALTLNQWTHVTCTYKLNKMMIYLNGVLDKEYNTSIVPSFTNVAYIGIGAGPNVTEPATAYLNDVRIYDHCLSPMEVKELAKGLVLHYPLNRNGWGQENLILGSNGVFVSGLGSAAGSRAEFRSKSVGLLPIELNKTYTLSFNVKMILNTPSNKPYLLVYNTNYRGEHGGWIYYNCNNDLAGNYETGDIIEKKIKITFTPTSFNPGSYTTDNIEFYSNYGSSNWFEISNIKLEEGSVATPWCPNSSDALATTMGLNSTIEYDCSGFCNNGTRTGTFSWTSDTPKYAVSTAIEKGRITSANSFTTVADPIFSVALWFKLKSEVTYTAYTDLISFSSSSYSNQPFRLEICGNPVGKSIMWFRGPSGQSGGFAVKSDLSFDTWYHTVLVSEGNKQYSYYVNGVKLGTYNGSANSWTPTGNVFLGENINGVFYESDFRIYATALSADDVKSLYQNCATIDPDGTIRGQIRS